MTAEIAVMNKKAVALAADSAVTIGGSGKIYSTENKLFMLSKYYPVGIMIFNNAQFMGIPWEIIIKNYREELFDNSFDSIEEYAEHFISWLCNIDSKLLSDNMRYNHLAATIYKIAYDQLEAAKEYMLSQIYDRSDKETINQEAIESTFFEYFALTERYLENEKSIFNISKKEVLKNQDLDSILNSALRELAIKIELSGKRINLIKKVVVEISRKLITSFTGVVFAGFGEKEYYPSVCSYNIGNLYGDKLKYLKEHEANGGKSSAIIPFAQSEMVTRFVEGIDPVYKEFFSEYIQDILMGYPQKIMDIVEGVRKDEKSDISKKISEISERLRKDIDSKLQELTSDKFINPIISNLDNLPIDELAEMALSLVNITSFKRRVSIDELETVGGPVDVAVITKGDGFIWIKRKHYFDPSLNHHFFKNYYKNK